MNKKFLYYIIQWTWGLPMNIIGGIVCLISLCFKCPIQKYRNAIEIIVPWNFGGLELGMFFVRGKNNASVAPHEYGHTIQNLWWGPLFPFVIAIPSAARYWLREFKTKQQKKTFISILFAIIELISFTLCVFFVGLYQFWFYVFLSIAIYGVILCIWLAWFEFPLYTDISKPLYDDIWFEGQATNLGNRANSGEWDWL